VAGLPGRQDRLGRAAGALGIGAVRVEPQAERDADRLRPRAQERNGAVDAAAHGHGDPGRTYGRLQDRTQRVRERVHGERLARDRRRLEQGQTAQRAVEPVRVGVDNAVPLNRQPDDRPGTGARRVSDDL
jgi:hypothetical protein